MKKSPRDFALGAALSLSLGAGVAHADLAVSASVNIHATAEFEAPLAAHGEWITVRGYGHCWHPDHVAVDWRPYGYGHWVWTDCGWYWVSDEPWAWACYHYGYWVYDPVHFWVWVPGLEWGPAWVSWRMGGGYIGWAPLPPPHFSVTVAEPHFVFVEANHFQDPLRPSVVIVNNAKVISQTAVIGDARRESRSLDGPVPQKVLFNEGPGLAVVQKATGRTLTPVPIQEAIRRTPAPSLRSGRGANPPPPDKTPHVWPGHAWPESPGEKGEGKDHGRGGEGHGKGPF
jgi:hypothetical protein